MRGLALFALWLPLLAASSFEEWRQEHGRVYADVHEATLRQKIFEENLNYIDDLNYLHNGSALFEMNKFGDLSPAEFKQRILMPSKPFNGFPADRYLPHSGASLTEDSFSWVDKGAVTNVKDQGPLGTCWAESAAGNLEGQLFIKHGVLESLSVEQIIECDNLDCSMFGGWPFNAMDYVKSAGGIVTDKDFGYCAGIPYGDPGSCAPCMPKGYNITFCGDHSDLYCDKKRDSCTTISTMAKAAKVSGWKAIPEDEKEIAAQLTQLGPFSVALNASPLQFYKKGIFNPPDWLCSPEDLDHAVLMVGYSEGKKGFKELDTWTIKNSWGPDWGENGYFRITRGTGKCGINRQVITAEIE